MSSRRLLTLLRWPRRDGPYEAALLGGEWPIEVRMLKEIHKEIALNRASKYVGTDYEYEPQIFVSPAEAAEHAAEEQAATQFQEREFDGLVDRLFSDTDNDSDDAERW